MTTTFQKSVQARLRSVVSPAILIEIDRAISDWSARRERADLAYSEGRKLRFRRQWLRILGLGRLSRPWRAVEVTPTGVTLVGRLRSVALTPEQVSASTVLTSTGVYARDERFEYEYPVRRLVIESGRSRFTIDITEHCGAYPFADLLFTSICSALGIVPESRKVEQDAWRRHWQRQLLWKSVAYFTCVSVGIFTLAASTSLAIAGIAVAVVGYFLLVAYPIWRLARLRKKPGADLQDGDART